MAQHTEQEYIERGDAFWKMQDWQQCIACYKAAIRQNPSSTARVKLEMVMQIIQFYNKDMLNP